MDTFTNMVRMTPAERGRAVGMHTAGTAVRQVHLIVVILFISINFVTNKVQKSFALFRNVTRIAKNTRCSVYRI